MNENDADVAERRAADCVRAAAVFACDPLLSGVLVCSAGGPLRDAWLAHLLDLLPKESVVRRAPLHITDDRLLGGLDLAATLCAGKPVVQKGLLAEINGGILIGAMAERLTAAAASRFASALDLGAVRLERDGFTQTMPARFGLIAFDESLAGEPGVPAILRERLPLRIDLDEIRHLPKDAAVNRDVVLRAREDLTKVVVSADVIQSLCVTAAALGIASLLAPLMAVRVARASAALAGRKVANDDDAIAAVRMVLAPRATVAIEAHSAEESPSQPSNDEHGTEARGSNDRQQPLENMLIEVAKACIPPRLLEALKSGGGRRSTGSNGKSGSTRSTMRRGRPVGVAVGKPGAGARVHVIETLRTAAPWQNLRRDKARPDTRRVVVRASDLRVHRVKQRSETTTIFVVDASGSSALHRFGEAKGAVELLLAECYVRRDQVALISFSGRGAELLLPPTRSLARAKRQLADIPGGGGTPLAAAIDTAFELADGQRRRGQTVSVVLLTDGRPNLCRDGRAGREAAQSEAVAASIAVRATGIAALLIDTSPQASQFASTLAEALGARYLALPHADAQTLAAAVQVGRNFQ